MKNIDEQLKIIKQGTAEIIQEADLLEKLKSKKNNGRSKKTAVRRLSDDRPTPVR